jgi:hypothetical protein
VEILEDDQQGPLASQLTKQVDPRLLQALAGHQGMKVSRDVKAERETEDRPGSEPFEHRGGVVAFQEVKN